MDKNSGQYKCPINQIFNEHRIFTYKDTAVVTPNSDTPYSFAVPGPARRAARCSPFPRLKRSVITRCSSTDWNTFNFGYIGSRATGYEAGDYLVVGPDWKGQTPAGIKKVFHATTQFALVIYRTQLFGPDDMPNVDAGPVGLQSAVALRVSAASPRHLPPRQSTSPRSTRKW